MGFTWFWPSPHRKGDHLSGNSQQILASACWPSASSSSPLAAWNKRQQTGWVDVYVNIWVLGSWKMWGESLLMALQVLSQHSGLAWFPGTSEFLIPQMTCLTGSPKKWFRPQRSVLRGQEKTCSISWYSWRGDACNLQLWNGVEAVTDTSLLGGKLKVFRPVCAHRHICIFGFDPGSLGKEGENQKL